MRLTRTRSREGKIQTRVVHLVATLRDGGAETLVRALIPRLAAVPSLDVQVVSVYDPRLDDAERAQLGAPLHVIGRRGRADLSFAPRLLQTLRRVAPDIVHGHIHTGKYAGRIAAIIAGVPRIVFTEHGDETGGVVRSVVKRILNARTDRFIVFTEAERRRYALAENLALQKIDVIANGIPLPEPTDTVATRKELRLQPTDFAIVTAARLVHQKNQELALRAVAKLRANGRKQLRLIVIGDGTDAHALRTLAAELDLADSVSFLGYRRDAQRLSAACDLMVLPSRWEKMPLVLGESMLCGVPVVTAPWTGVREFVEHGQTGYVTNDWSVDAFSSAIASAIDDSFARREIAAAAKETALDRFDLERTVARHASLYQSLSGR